MMKAAISGRAAAALVVDGDMWYRIDGENPSEVKPAGPRAWQYVFGVSQDVQYLEVHSFDEVRQTLVAAVDEDYALSLALICLDITTKETTRRVAADDLETIIKRTPGVTAFLWKVFASRPLTYDASIYDAFHASLGEARRFFVELNACQPAITTVRQSWEAIGQELFSAIDRDELLAYATHAGFPLVFAEAAHRNVRPDLPELEGLPEYWKVGDVRRIVSQWVDEIACCRTAKKRVLVLENTHLGTAAATWEERPTFFGAADPDLESLQSIDFHASLINNLLFRRRLLVPDSYFFTSAGIAEHLARPASLLEAAITAGLVTAACLYRGLGFDATYDILRRQRVLTAQCKFVHRLQTAADRAEVDVFAYCSTEGIGESYDRYLTILQAKDPPAGALHIGGSGPLLRHWLATQDWRLSIINDAREATLKRRGHGVHKRELLRYLVKAVIGVFVPEITGIGQLLRLGGELVERIRVFWSWTSEGHRFSRARELDALLYSPGYEKVQNLFVTNALGSLPDTEPLRVRVRMPSTDSLKLLHSDDIIQLRLGPGASYQEALVRWHDAPDRQAEVELALAAYAVEISKLCVRRLPGAKLKVVELTVGLPSKNPTDDRNQFASMTTFDSELGRKVRQLMPGGKVGPVTTNDQTDVVVDLPN